MLVVHLVTAGRFAGNTLSLAGRICDMDNHFLQVRTLDISRQPDRDCAVFPGLVGHRFRSDKAGPGFADFIDDFLSF